MAGLPGVGSYPRLAGRLAYQVRKYGVMGGSAPAASSPDEDASREALVLYSLNRATYLRVVDNKRAVTSHHST